MRLDLPPQLGPVTSAILLFPSSPVPRVTSLGTHTAPLPPPLPATLPDDVSSEAEKGFDCEARCARDASTIGWRRPLRMREGEVDDDDGKDDDDDDECNDEMLLTVPAASASAGASPLCPITAVGCDGVIPGLLSTRVGLHQPSAEAVSAKETSTSRSEKRLPEAHTHTRSKQQV